MDELLVRVEAEAAYSDTDTLAAFGQRCANELRKVLGVRVKVEPVLPGVFPRTDFKARRVIDDRNLYQELNSIL